MLSILLSSLWLIQSLTDIGLPSLRRVCCCCLFSLLSGFFFVCLFYFCFWCCCLFGSWTSVSTAILAGLAGISHVDQELLRSPSKREILSGSVILKPAIRRFFFFRGKEKSQGRLGPPDGRLRERRRREGRSRARENERCKSPLTT